MSALRNKQSGQELVDLAGLVTGKVTVIGLSNVTGKNYSRLWICRCECGNEFLKNTHSLKSGITKTCKECWRKNSIIRSTKHGLRHTPEYITWQSMKNRCYYTKEIGYKRYGGRGIGVCERWMDINNFYADMGEKPTPSHSLDRINNDGNYEPGNCRWSTKQEQANNRNITVRLTAFGETKTVSDWVNDPRCNVGHILLLSRIRSGFNHTPEEFLTKKHLKK